METKTDGSRKERWPMIDEEEKKRREAIDRFMAYIESLPPMAIVD